MGRSGLAGAGKAKRAGSLGGLSVELALILPVLLLLLMGLAEMSRMYMCYLTIQKACQVGTRFAVTGQGVIEGNRLTRIIAQTSTLISTLPGTVQIQVRSWPGTAVSGSGRLNNPGDPCDTVEVQAVLGYQPAMPLITPILPATINLTGADRKVNEPWLLCGG
jgi:Flp pilus assembly protein TadG